MDGHDSDRSELSYLVNYLTDVKFPWVRAMIISCRVEIIEESR